MRGRGRAAAGMTVYAIVPTGDNPAYQDVYEVTYP
jgi:hypothetical protein